MDAIPFDTLEIFSFSDCFSYQFGNVIGTREFEKSFVIFRIIRDVFSGLAIA